MNNEQLRESLSAMMDNEHDELELRRVIKSMDGSTELQTTWSRYHLVSHGLRKQLPITDLKIDLTQTIRSALDAEETLNIKNPNRFSVIARTAMVASVVTLSIILTAQFVVNHGAISNGTPASQVAAVQPSFTQTQGAQQASFTVDPQMTEQQLRVQNRLNRYLAQHAEQSALQNNGGVLPFVRANAQADDQQ